MFQRHDGRGGFRSRRSVDQNGSVAFVVAMISMTIVEMMAMGWNQISVGGLDSEFGRFAERRC